MIKALCLCNRTIRVRAPAGMTTAVLFAGMSFLRLGRSSHDGFPDAEVGDDPVPFVQQDVLGLDVAMHDVVTVRILQPFGDLFGNVQCILDRQLLLAIETVAQCLSAEVVHYVEEVAVRLAAVMNPDDVRVMQACSDADLALEARDTDLVGERGVQELDRHRTA